MRTRKKIAATAVLFLCLLFESVACAAKPVRSPSGISQVSYADAGNPTGIPIVFVHAFPLSQAMWDDQVEALRKTARVITFDVRGLGKSALDAPYTLEFVVDDLIGLLDQMKIERAVVCGLSMGGFVALRAVERNPERFSGLILADTRSEPDSDKSKLGRYQALKTIQEQGLSVYLDGFLKAAASPSALANRPEVVARELRLMESNSASGVSAAVLALTSRTDTTAGLGEIKVPTLIMQGEADSVIPIGAAQSLHEKIKGSSFFIVPGAGHLSNLENSGAFNERLIQFLVALSKGAGQRE